MKIKRRKPILAVLLILPILLAGLFCVIFIFTPRGADNSTVPQTRSEAAQSALYVFGPPSALHVTGNSISNTLNTHIIFKGLMIPDPSVLYASGRLNNDLFQTLRHSGANIVRLPVHPDLWRKDTAYLEKYIDPAVTWANALNMYIIIDWHYIGNIAAGDIKDDSENFWAVIAARYKDNPGVIFELCNEPTDITPEQWLTSARALLKLIRDHGANQLIIVGGVQYSQDLSQFVKSPLADSNIAYAAHIYPAHEKKNWDRWFGVLSKNHPVLITEWGYMDENRNSTQQKFLVGDRESYGVPFLRYLQERNIGWVACWYDDTWEPEMLKKDAQGCTAFGQFVMDELKLG